MANVVGQAFVQLQFEFDQTQLNRAAQRAADNLQAQLNAKLRGAQGRLGSASSALGETAGSSFARGLVDRASAGLTELTRRFDSFGKTLTPIATGVAGAFAGIIGVAGAVSKAGIDAASDLQNLEQSLKAIFGELDGTTEKTNAFIASLRELSKASGQSFNQLGQTGRTLIATGLSAERTTEILTTFSKAAALSGASTRQFELALLGLTQVQAKGRLSSEELRRQIAENLPGAISVTKVYEQLAKSLDLTTKEVIALQEAGGITADQGIQAILDAINETEGISRAFEARLQTLDGQLGVLRETFNEVVQLGFKPFVGALAAGFNEIRQDAAFADIQKELQDFSNVMGKVTVDAIKELLPIVPDLVKTFTELAEAVAPLVVDIANITRTALQLILPVVNLTADIINLILNGLGPLSTIIRQLVAGAVLGGLVSLLGKVAGAFRLLGPVANGISRALAGVAAGAKKLTPIISVLAAGIGLLQNAIEGILSPFVKFLDFLNLSLGPVKSFIGGVANVAGAVGSGIKSFFGFNNEANKTPEILNRSLNPLNSLNSLFGVTIQRINQARGILNLFGGTLNSIGGIFGKTATLFADLTTRFGPELISKALDPFISKFDAVAAAGDRLKSAQQGVISAQEKLNELLQKGKVDLEEVARAEERLITATERITDAQQGLADAQQGVVDALQAEKDALLALQEARTPATPSELAEAEDNLTRARIAQAQATRDLKKAEDELDDAEVERVNLAGLSLDQIRTTIAGIRASAAAKRAAKKEDEEDAKTDEELQEEQILREIDVRDAIRSVEDAEKDLQELKQKGTATDEDVIQAQKDLAQASRDVEDAKRDEEKAVRDIERAKRDEIAANRELETARQGDPTFDRQLAEARREITTAKQQEITAQRELNLAVAEATGNQQRIVDLKLEELRLNKELILQSPDLARNFVASFGNLGNIVSGLKLTGPFSEIQRIALLGQVQSPEFIRKVAEKLLNTPGSSLRDILKQLGVPGLMAGGVVTSPTLAHIGEFARPEAVMPLTHPGNFFKTWQQAMPLMHPAIREAFTPQIPKISSGGRSTSVKPSRSDLLLNEILLALQEGGGRATIEAPITVNPGPGMDERLLARQVARKLRREMKRRG